MAIPRECKRLAEVDFPIAVVSKHAVREKSIRHGHPSTLHLWWARRPLASCRAMLLALLLPDPCDEHCPDEFKTDARAALADVQRAGPSDQDLRAALLKFIGDFANWDLAANQRYIDAGRALIRAAHPEEPPLVVDPFAGGGSIPLEALRLGCEVFATDLNPVAALLLKVALEDVPRSGSRLSERVREEAVKIREAVQRELEEVYPLDPDGSRPITYLWARTVRCETPNCGAEIPLMRSFWLTKKSGRPRALRQVVVRETGQPPRIDGEMFEPANDAEVQVGTVSRARAICAACRITLAPERVRAQLVEQRGGSDVVFDSTGHRSGGALMLAVVTLKPGVPGRHYRLPENRDYAAVWAAAHTLQEEASAPGADGLSAIPNEPTPVGGGAGAGRAFALRRYGMMTFGDLFSVRQKLALLTFAKAFRKQGSTRALSLAFGKLVDLSNALCPWEPVAECPRNVLSSGRMKPSWDFAEGVPISDASGSFTVCVENLTGGLDSLKGIDGSGASAVAAAQRSPLPHSSAAVWFTDPPYYDAIPYSDLADFFLVWYKRVRPQDALLNDPFDPSNPLSPKRDEAVYDESKIVDGRPKSRDFFEQSVAESFEVGRHVLREDGIASVIFAHKTTEGWEALLSGITRGGWTVTGSWPIATEQAYRPRARDSAALATSVHLICRPRPEDAPVADWADVLRELPIGVGKWMQRLQAEGVRGADLVFACIGPALEIYSRYSKVVDAEDREIPLGGDPEAADPYQRGYLAYVWETVGRAALQQVLGQDEGAGALEEDARLVALFLWTLQSTNGANSAAHDEDEPEEDDSAGEEDEDEDSPGRKPKGYTLIFDVARRFAQPLGIHLDDWEGRVIETKKGIVRLLPVAERAKQLFGEEGAQAAADRIEKEPASAQLSFFPEMQAESKPRRGRRKVTITASDESISQDRNATTLDRLHIAMLLQSSGRANALRALLAAEQQRGPEFLRLANALSALYPRESEEKRLLDAMLLAVPN